MYLLMMCWSQSTKCFRKKVRINIWYFALKKSLFLVYTRNGNISRECVTKMEFLEGGGGNNFGNREGMEVIGKISSVGGMDIFWNYTLHYVGVEDTKDEIGNGHHPSPP